MNKYLNRLEQSRIMPISLEAIRYHINAHPMESDEDIRRIGEAACEIVERKIGQSIMLSKWELYDERSEILLDMPPVRSVEELWIKSGRKWSKVDDDYSIEKTYLVNGGVRIKINDWEEDTKMKIVYTAGYSLEDTSYKIPASIIQYILNFCISLYHNKGETKAMARLQSHLIATCRPSYESIWSIW